MLFFDESTYKNRFLKFLELTNVKHLFHSSEKIAICKNAIENCLSSSKDDGHIYAACVHPDTKEIIPFYGRMAFFVPINIPICAGMLLTKPSFQNIVFWQWFNQTYNAIFNYSNSPKSNSSEKALNENALPILKSYAGSVIISVGLAVSLTRCVKSGKIPESLNKLGFQKLVPFLSSASAGMANVFLMRGSELLSGIPVYNNDSEYFGHSKIAARNALLQTAISRAVIPIPALVLPTPVITLASKLRFFNSSFFRKKLVEIIILTASLAVGLPAALALFPQYSFVKPSDLEFKLQEKTHSYDPMCLLKYNKGV